MLPRPTASRVIRASRRVPPCSATSRLKNYIKFIQTWREKPANKLRFGALFGKTFGVAKSRTTKTPMKSNEVQKVHMTQKNLYLEYRFFYPSVNPTNSLMLLGKIYRFFAKSGALRPVNSRAAHSYRAPTTWQEPRSTSGISAQTRRIHTKWMPGITYNLYAPPLANWCCRGVVTCMRQPTCPRARGYLLQYS